MNEQYVKKLASWVIRGVLNPKTNQPFKLDDIVDPGYRAAVENIIVKQ